MHVNFFWPAFGLKGKGEYLFQGCHIAVPTKLDVTENFDLNLFYFHFVKPRKEL